MTQINGITYRKHIKGDFEQIAEIEALVFSSPWSQKAVEEFTENSYSGILVAELNKKVLGYITYSSIIDEIQIANVATHPDFRRMHIAQNLLELLIDKAKINNTLSITLEVRESNIKAISLYDKCNFKVIGKRKNYYSNPKENALIMTYTF